MRYFYNSWHPAYKSHFGAIARNQSCQFTIRLPEETPLDEISIQDVPLSLAAEVTLSDVYEFLNYTFTEKSNNARTRARKVSALRGLYKYLTNNVGLIPTNPIEKLELPTAKQALPTYLNLEQCYDLLRTFDQADPNHPRDYCIVTLFLNCGMRLSEMSGLNVNSFRDNTLRVLGKGNKERMLYLNDACMAAMKTYLETHGLSSDRILTEDQSTNTRENLIFSAQLIPDNASVGIVSNGFHICRALHLAKVLGYKNAAGIPTKSDLITQPANLLREFFAVVKDFWLLH